MKNVLGLIASALVTLLAEFAATDVDLVTIPRREGTQHAIYTEFFTEKRIDVDNVEFEVTLPPTSVDKKSGLCVTILRKNRRCE